jgi:DNA-binding response OmpR family regulator
MRLKNIPRLVLANARRIRRAAASILLVECDGSEVLFMTIALGIAKLSGGLHVVGDDEEALAYFRGRGKFIDRTLHPLPTLVFMNLKLPGLTGFALLKWIRRRPQFDQVVVIAWTGPEDSADAAQGSLLGANFCLAKPVPRIGLVATIALIKRYWLRRQRRSAASLA